MVYAAILPAILKAKSCTGKIRHKSRNSADRAMKAVASRFLAGNTEGLHSYKCRFCSGYHFGHVPKLMGHLEIPT